jgi:hypothetical protein
MVSNSVAYSLFRMVVVVLQPIQAILSDSNLRQSHETRSIMSLLFHEDGVLRNSRPAPSERPAFRKECALFGPLKGRSYFIAIPWGRAGPVLKAVLKSRLKCLSSVRVSWLTLSTWTLWSPSR